MDDLPSNPSDGFTGRKLDPTLLEKVPVEEHHCECFNRLMKFRCCRCPQNRSDSFTNSCTRPKMCGSRSIPHGTEKSSIRKKLRLNSSRDVSRRVDTLGRPPTIRRRWYSSNAVTKRCIYFRLISSRWAPLLSQPYRVVFFLWSSCQFLENLAYWHCQSARSPSRVVLVHADNRGLTGRRHN